MAKVISRPSSVTSPQKMIAFMQLKHTIFLLLLQHIVSGHGQPLQYRRHRAILQEKATLLSFKNTIISPPQAALANWNESTDVCDFIGVICDRWRLHVVRLQLRGRLVSSPLSPVLANLSSLRELDLSNNSLTGHIPHEYYSNLRHLKILDLSTNSLDGQIPPSLANLTGLEWLRLSGNHLDGPIPPSLANLTGLKWLDLSYNYLTGHIPDQFSNLQHLEVLELSGNHLDGPIPQSLATISSLFYVNLGYNSLTGQIPASIFRNCSKLRDVDFSFNYLTGEIPSEARIYLPNLRILNLYSDNLTGKLPTWLSNSSFLSQLDVECNFLSGELPSDIVSNKTYLEGLRLSYNNFSSHHNNTDLRPFFLAISNCSNLRELEMEGLALGGPMPQIVGGVAKSLSEIQLGDNRILGPIPPDIGYLFNITLLNLSSNLLNGTIPNLIGQLPKLERLILSNNFLSGPIPPEIGNISSIGLLDLSNNKLSGEIPRSLGNLSLISEIHLQKNELYGEIPASLGRCISLLKLDLSYNRLTGRIPRDMSGIVKISFNLSHNQLQGPLPIELSKMDQVQEIDLSSNNLTGEVISQLSACAELKLINLSHNSLQGQLPKSFGDLQNLETLDVSFNYLTGEIPLNLNECTGLTHLNLSYNDFNGPIPVGGVFSLFTNLSYLGNQHLCGSVVGQACFERKRWLHSHKFLIIICVSTSLLALLLLALCCAIGIRKTRSWIFRGRDDSFGSLSLVLKSSFPRITYRELVEATGEFDQDRLIGSGSYGRVYKGVLRDGTIVAVKVLHLQTGNSTKSFNRECQVLKRIRHRNLMRIITACSRPDFKALVLPFMANGSLESFLYSGSSELSLIQRVNICSDIAEGIAYLHHHSPVKVIHCDLKPSNVLLNDDMTALVSDFGIARLVMNVGAGNATEADDMGTSTANMLRGSIGYIAPEYGFGSDASTKGDVYSFGVVVLEMVARKRPTDEMFKGGLSLPNWVKSHYIGRMETVIDASLVTAVKNQTYEVKRMWEVAIGELVDLGLLCTQESPSSRPTMLDAADDLGRLKRYLSGDTTASFATSLGMSSSTTGEDPGASISNFD
ncbi:uncharacterized protein [Elaeis guineensis]|uniref:uncharacterized protein n=1 Tax=Elaeis guineensis var. tenera TaxID=51953 RepID=UPI000579C0D8